MNLKGRLSSCVLAALLLVTVWTFPARAEESALPEVPAVTVAGVRVTDGAHFEVGLRISAKQFQTVGVVLSYDTEKLIPVDWSGMDAAIPAAASWNAAAPAALHTVGMNALAGKPALAYRDSAPDAHRGYIYLGADALQYTALHDAQVATVRFRYAADVAPEAVTMPTAEALAAGAADSFTVELAPAENAADAIPGAPVLVTASADLVYRPDTAAFTLTDGLGVSTGGAAFDGKYAITFFDWDGRVIDAIAAEGDAGKAVQDFAALESVKDTLEGKPGYRFDKWLAVDRDLEPVHGTFSSNDHAISKENPDTSVNDVADFQHVTASMLVKASYVAVDASNGDEKDFVNQGAGLQPLTDARTYYAFGTPSYYQYGGATKSGGQYAIRCPIGRGSARRAVKPAIAAQIFTSDTDSTTLKIDLTNTDATSFEIVVPRNTIRVEYTAIDTDGFVAWTGADARSDKQTVQAAVYVKEGAFALLADTAYNAYVKAGAWDAAVDEFTFQAAGYPKVASGNLNDAKTKLQTYITENSITTKPTRSQMDSALAAYK